jgi:hypothetical protein
MLALANLFLPELLYERVLAAISPESRQNRLFYQIEPGNERELADRLNIHLSDGSLDDSGKKLVFEEFKPEQPVPGAKIVFIELLDPLEESQIPVCLSFFRYENKLVPVHKSAAVRVARNSDDSETARLIGKVLTLALQSVDP